MERFFQAVTEFIFAQDSPEKADIIFLPGSAHTEHVKKAAELYLAGYAPRILPSGAHSTAESAFGDSAFDSEWAWMRRLLLDCGVPDAAILREDRATYTWQNALLSRQVTDEMGLRVRTGLIACQPSHARRALFYYQAAFPEARLLVCPASVPGLNRDDWFLTCEGREKVLGEVRRLGSQINQVLEDAIKPDTRVY